MDSDIHRNQDVIEVRRLIDDQMKTLSEHLRQHVRECVSTVLNCAPEELLDTQSLADVWGADSLDFVDIEFRLSELFKVTVSTNALLEIAFRSVADDGTGVVSPHALSRLTILMPEADSTRLTAPLRSSDIERLFSLETFVRLVVWRLIVHEQVPAGARSSSRYASPR